MIGNDHHIVAISPGCFHHFTHTLIHGIYRFFDGCINTGMSHHITIGKVETDKIGAILLNIFNHRIFHLKGTHLRLQVIGGNLG